MTVSYWINNFHIILEDSVYINHKNTQHKCNPYYLLSISDLFSRSTHTEWYHLSHSSQHIQLITAFLPKLIWQLVAQKALSPSLSLTSTQSWWLWSISLIVRCFVLCLRFFGGSSVFAIACLLWSSFNFYRFSDDWLVNFLLQISHSNVGFL